MLYRRILVGGVTAAAIVGAGGTAIALTGTDAKQGHLLRRLAHGQFVTKGKDGKFVTHDLITGTVTSVSSTSITVQAADKKSETFAVGQDTKVRERTVGQKTASGQKTKGKATASSISQIAKGDHVVVAGTGTTKLAAKRIVEVKGTK